MKYLRLVLCLTVVALFSHATTSFAESYDSETATVQKKGAHTAKVCIDKKKETFTTQVCFADGASWNNVKDHYEISSSTAAGLENGSKCIRVNADGSAAFIGCSSSHCSKPSKK